MHSGSHKHRCFLSPLHCGLQTLSLPCVLISHWTAWLGQTQGHGSHVLCVALLIAAPSLPCVLFPVPQTIVDNKPLCRADLFFVLCHAVEGRCQSSNSLTYSGRLLRRVILEPRMLVWCRLSQGSGFSTLADHLELAGLPTRSLLADKSAAQHH